MRVRQGAQAFAYSKSFIGEIPLCPHQPYDEVCPAYCRFEFELLRVRRILNILVKSGACSYSWSCCSSEGPAAHGYLGQFVEHWCGLRCYAE